MDFALSDEQRLLQQSVERLFTDRYAFDARKRYAQEATGWSSDLWRQAVHVPRCGACPQHPGPRDHGRHRADPGLGDLLDGSRREAPPQRAMGRTGAIRDRRQGASP